MDPRTLAPLPPLALALAGLEAARDPRTALEWVAAAGFNAVQLDAASPALRPRDLDRSARRDLAALLRRLELTCSGVDLLIPAEHFADPQRSDRAASATADAIDFAADMASLAGGAAARPSLSLALPAEGAEGAVGALVDRADRRSTALADLTWPPREAAPDASSPLRIGLDPAALLLAGADPALEAARLAPRLASARLSDISAAGRVPPGRGRLDVLAYGASLVATGYGGFLVLDLRAVPNQQAVAASVLAQLGAARPR